MMEICQRNLDILKWNCIFVRSIEMSNITFILERCLSFWNQRLRSSTDLPSNVCRHKLPCGTEPSSVLVWPSVMVLSINSNVFFWKFEFLPLSRFSCWFGVQDLPSGQWEYSTKTCSNHRADWVAAGWFLIIISCTGFSPLCSREKFLVKHTSISESRFLK